MNYKKMILPPGCTVLNVLVIGRVSTTHQDIKNIEAGYQYAEKVLDDVWSGATVIKRLGEQGSGMLVARETILKACELIENGWAHLVLMEDVSKSYRNPRWIYTFVQDCVDRDVRVIAPGDMLDTYDDNWEVTLGTAALRHGLHIPDTRRRVRRTSSQTFSQGGMVQKIRAGYRKLTKEEAESGQFGPKGLRMAKIPEWTPIFQKLREMVVKNHKGGAELALWLNSQDPPVPVPPYCKQKHWEGRLVLSVLRDDLLHGLRQFPKERYEPRFSDGGHKRSKNANPQRQHYPELAHMTEEQQRQMVQVLDEIGEKEKATQRAGPNSPRYRVARSKSLTPLQHAVCSACHKVYYLVGADVTKCKNALKHYAGGCWNHVQVSCLIVRKKLVELLLEILESNPAAKQAFLDTAWEQIDRVLRQGRRSADEFDKQIADLAAQEKRIAEGIAAGGKLESLVTKLKATQAARKKLEKQRQELADSPKEGNLPVSKETLMINPKEALMELANTSFEFASLLRKIIPKFVIEPVQALDCGQVRPQGRLTIDLSVLLDNASDAEGSARERVIEFFDRPEHVKHLDRVIALRNPKRDAGQKHSLDILAGELRIGRMTVKRALAYEKLMIAAGVQAPYRVLMAPPESASRWKPRKARTPDDPPATDAE
jgi:hypothetical protein